MRDAPVLMKVANPSSQDRTPRRAIVLAVSPAAANYRESGLVLWVEADIRFLRSSRAAIGILATFRGRRANVSLKSKSGDAIEHARALTRCIVPRS